MMICKFVKDGTEIGHKVAPNGNGTPRQESYRGEVWKFAGWEQNDPALLIAIFVPGAVIKKGAALPYNLKVKSNGR